MHTSILSARPYLEKNDWGANIHRMAKGHGEGKGVGGGHETPFHKVNGKLKRGPLIICTCSCCTCSTINGEKKIPLEGGRPLPCPPPKYGPAQT